MRLAIPADICAIDIGTGARIDHEMVERGEERLPLHIGAAFDAQPLHRSGPSGACFASQAFEIPMIEVVGEVGLGPLDTDK